MGGNGPSRNVQATSIDVADGAQLHWATPLRPPALSQVGGKFMKRCLLVLAVLWVSELARAEFTASEKAELAELTQARLGLYLGIHFLSQAVPSAASRAAYHDALLITEQAAWECYAALAYLLGSTLETFPSRAQQVDAARIQLTSCVSDLDSAALAVQPFSQDASDVLRVAWNGVNGFDQSLSFDDPRPASYPRLVGPHGDYDFALRVNTHAGQYFHEVLFDAIRFYGTVRRWPNSANAHFARALSNGAAALAAHARAYSMDAEIVLTDDAEAINIDQANGSGLRGFDFFRLVRETTHELNGGFADTPVTFAGQTVPEGVPLFLYGFQDAFALVIASCAGVNNTSEISRWWNGGGAARSMDPDGNAYQFFTDLADAWRGIDTWGMAAFNFFHEIPAPPSGGLTCGPGTRREGNQCVAAPASCPTFVAEMVLLNPTTAEARCVAMNP